MRQNVFITYYSLRAVLLGTAFLFVSCDDLDTKSLGEINRNFADRTIQNAFVIRKDSGEIRMELRSPLIEEFTMIDSPYTVMRKGLNVKFWNSSSPKPNFLKADWAKIKSKINFYEGKGNVEMINNDGDTLRTEHIFWDNKNRRIFTKDTVIIKRLDGTVNVSNNGLEATEDFKEFTFYANHGVIVFDQNKAKESKTNAKPDSLNSKKKLVAPKGMKELNPKKMKLKPELRLKEQ